MTAEDNFLSRWSRRKREASTGEVAEGTPGVAREPKAPLVAPAEKTEASAVEAAPEPLPPLESLTPESDFTRFMEKDVDGDVRRKALKALFSDPRFNVMDMMDVYVDDYSKPDPIPESWLGKLEQMSRLGDRAGRDREEEARRKALEEAQAATEPEAVPEAAEAAGADGDGPPAEGAAAPPADGGTQAGNPPQDVGESGT